MKVLGLAGPPGGHVPAKALFGFRAVTETNPNTFVYALALHEPTGWHVQIGVAEDLSGQLLAIDDVTLPLPAKAPVSAFVSLTGGFFAGPAGGALVVLGPAGTERIEYTGCRGGRSFTTGSNGDFLILTTGPLEEAGALTVRSRGALVPLGRPQDVSRLPLVPPPSTDVSGYGDKLADTQLKLVAFDRSRTVRFEPPDPRLRLAEAVVLGVCSGRGSVLFEGTALPCDGRTHQVWAGTLNFEHFAFEVTGVPDPSTGRTSVSVALTVAGL